MQKALDTGNVEIYAADVFWQEPPDYNNIQQANFLARKDVLITPHYAWYSEESEREVRRRAAGEILRFLKKDS